DPVRREQGKGIEPERTAHAFHAGVHVFSVEGRLQRRHAGRLAARAPGEIRPERAQLQGAGEEIEGLSMTHDAQLVDYYAKRAGEYERIYDKPKRQNDLAIMK